MSSSSANASRAAPEKPSLQEVVERIGFGPAQLRFVLTGGGVWLADGAELLLITAVTQTVSADWHLSAVQRGMTVTFVFIGVLFGNLLCGPLGDTYGRRQLILTSYCGIFIWSVLSSTTASYPVFCLFRLLVGFSFGMGQPAWNTLCTEITPSYFRIPMNAGSQALFVVGEIYSALLIMLDDPTLTALNWRRLLQLGAIPSLLFAIAASLFLLQSPSFLALRGRTEEARAVLDVMKSDNKCEASLSTDFHVNPPSRLSSKEVGYQLKELFNRTYRLSTLIVGLTCFGLNLLYYGCLYAFPQILLGLTTHGTPGLQLLVGAFWEFPGIALGVVFGMCMARKPALKLATMIMVLNLTIFVVGISMKESAFSVGLWHVGYYGIKASGPIGFVIAYQYAAEIYPTEIRATGTAFCIGSGRLGALMAPLVFEGLQDIFKTYNVWFYLLIAFMIFNFLIIDLLPFETATSLVKERLMSDMDTEDPEAYGAVNERDLKSEASTRASPRSELDDGCTKMA